MCHGLRCCRFRSRSCVGGLALACFICVTYACAASHSSQGTASYTFRAPLTNAPPAPLCGRLQKAALPCAPSRNKNVPKFCAVSRGTIVVILTFAEARASFHPAKKRKRLLQTCQLLRDIRIPSSSGKRCMCAVCRAMNDVRHLLRKSCHVRCVRVCFRNC